MAARTEGEDGDTRQLIGRIDAAMTKSTGWLKKNLPQTEASFTNGQEGLALDCSTYMVLPLAYSAAGRVSDATWAMNYMERTFIQADGSGSGSVGALKNGSMAMYAQAWSAVSCVRMGRQDLAQKIMRHVLRFQGTGRWGGFFGGQKEAAAGRGIFCFDSSGAGIVACVLTARLEEARRGGEFLLRLAELSTNERWYWALTSDGKAVESHADPLWRENASMPCPVTNMCYMEKEYPGQGHWKTGFFVACCTYLYRLLGDERYLEAATRCAAFALATKDAPAISGAPWLMFAHKLAWGMSELYKTTRRDVHLQMAKEIGTMLVERQNEEGFFPYGEWFPTNHPEPPFPGNQGSKYATPSSCLLASHHRGKCAEPATVTYSICAQATIWMSKVKEALEISLDGTLDANAGAGTCQPPASKKRRT